MNKSDVVRVGIIGFGQRGMMLLDDVFLPMCEEGELNVIAVCDSYEDRAAAAADKTEKKLGVRPACTTNYREVVSRTDIDAVVIASAWESHVEIAIASMEAGHFTAMEVGGAYSLEDCWELVRVSERTGSQCMMLENCCYGEIELLIMNMARQGVLGDVVHCSGGYHHDLRSEIVNGKENRHYRLNNYLNRNCENYPTHELGPIAKLLDINNGNRLVSLTSTASCSRGLHEYVLDRKGADHPLANAEFLQGDVVTTVIRCAGGQTIVLTLDTTLPRSYSRAFTVRGTRGSYYGDTKLVYLDHVHTEVKAYEWDCRPLWGNVDEYKEKYVHPLWKDYIPHRGHDGMDWHVMHAMTEAVRAGCRPPIDVYDTAVMLSITPLSEQSILTGGSPVEIPDFTRGRWYDRKDIAPLKYNLDKIK